MPQFIRHHVNADTRITWVLPILTGLLIGCLLAFIANLFLKEMRLTSNSTDDPFAASASKPATELKKPARYEAVKSNWAKYRSEPKD
jgi:hypothetical protein